MTFAMAVLPPHIRTPTSRAIQGTVLQQLKESLIHLITITALRLLVPRRVLNRCLEPLQKGLHPLNHGL